MRICFNFGGKQYCIYIPIYEYPIFPPKPDPTHQGYSELITDATILASAHKAIQGISDGSVRESALSGLNSAVKALQNRAGENVSVSFSH